MVYLPHWPGPASFGNAQIDYEQVFVRLEKILQKLDNPQRKLTPAINITGTNGKGSVAAFLSQILRDQGLKVNSYSSPHIHHVNERFMINNYAISDSQLFDLIEEVRIANDNEKITFFEAMTATAILAFYKNQADFNIFEVGMGARIDATNIIENRAANIITPISFDHEEYLGNNIAKIAFEKAHILKANTPLIVGPQPQEAMQIIQLIAQDQEAKITKYDQDFSIEINEDESFNFKNKEFLIKNIAKPKLLGQHQYINATIAIQTALNLGLKIDQEKIKKSLAQTCWQNRLEKVNNSLSASLGANSELFIDSAHNNGGAYALSKWLEEEKLKNEDKINFAIVGFSRGKCRAQFLKTLQQSFDTIYAVRVEGEPYPEEIAKIEEVCTQNNIHVKKADDLLTAIYEINKNQQPKRVVICGSIHLARDLKKYSNI